MTLLPVAGRNQTTGDGHAAGQDTVDPWASRGRMILISLVVGAFLLVPAIRIALRGPHNDLQWFQLTGAIALSGIIFWQLSYAASDVRRTYWVSLLAIDCLALALFIAGGPNWLATVAVAAGVSGRFTRASAPAFATAAAFSLTGLILAAVHHYASGNVFAVLLIAPLATLFGYGRARSAVTLNMLRRTRAELARAAVAEERLRIARDLHDLLGHSLSLITLKAELAGRVISTDPARAATEIGELESVARQSLADVRGAVAGFRQPDLAGELVAARQLLDAAGIAARITSAETAGLPQEVDSALAWAVREGATNVVRHSTATQVFITVSIDPAAATAEIRDNGRPVPDDAAPTHAHGPGAATLTAGPGRTAVGRLHQACAGSGLAGLAERVRGLGGELSAGLAGEHGFLLRVAVPLDRPA
ncbi:MAG TPA: histidine kinase [Streptosporangiaceae bacterium]|nr:histidine kinase [Streptosporangiaceae bacterium]